MSVRETWATRVGFILAAVGSAVGLGNIWRFPFLTAESGGAAFLVAYLLLVVLIGLPILLAEFVIGRESKQNVVDAFPEIGKPNWKVLGGLGALTGFVILSYYSVVGGWTIQYFIASLTGEYAGNAEAFFGSASSGTNAVAFDALFMAFVAGIVAFGVRDGLERAAKVMIPSVVGLMILLAAYGATLQNAGAGYAYYLSPDTSTLLGDAIALLPEAAGQAFFTLSIGMGVMITYSSYLDEDRSLLSDSLIILVMDTFIAFLAGLVVFPILFAQGITPEIDPIGMTFIALASAFSSLPGGQILGAVFFFMLFLASLTSAFSILEVIVAFVVDTFGVARRYAAIGLGALIFLIGVPTALNINYLGLYDTIAVNILQISGGLLLAVFVGWVYADGGVTELKKGSNLSDTVAMTWIWFLRVPVVLVLAYVLYVAVPEVAATIQSVVL